MARQSRIRLPGYPFHITQRGHNKSATFLDDTCFLVYQGLMGRMSPRHGCRIHAHVLMTNHVHILATGEGPDSLSALMKGVNEQYGRFFNRRFRRVGTVWQARFDGSVVDSTEYLLTCCQYIDMNPVRAGMVEHPRDYPWTSHRVHAEGESCPFISPHPVQVALGGRDLTRQQQYRQIIEAPIPEELLQRVRSASRSSLPLGGEAFCRDLAERFGVRTERCKPGPRKGDPSKA